MGFKYADIGDLSYVKKITLDVSGGVSNRVIEAKQGDINSRYLQITLIQNDKPFIIPENTTVRIGGTKPDGHCFLNDGDIYNNAVYVELTEQMLAVGGREKCDVSLYNGTRRLSSVTFHIDITVEPYDEGKIQSDDEYTSLTEALSRVDSADAIAEGALEKSEQALNNLDVLNAAELNRENAETLRVQAEQDRSSAESKRVIAEATRNTAEQTRANNENTRATAEAIRANAEIARVNSENSRVTAETARVTAETSRNDAETSRGTAEGLRDSAEKERASAELSRVSAENTRKSNEQTRQNQEVQRQAAYNAFQGSIDDNEIATQLLLAQSQQQKWKTDDFLKVDTGTVTLTNTLAFPFNNSIKSVALSDERFNTDYTIYTEIVSAEGIVGDIEISDKLINGFKIAYTGSAKSVTVKYYITGGYTI